MYLTLTSTADQAGDLGYLLHKHPGRAQSLELSVGTAHVFYPEATDERCTAALLLEVDPIDLVRGRRFGGDRHTLTHYVNDRPYAASSLLAVALGRVFRTALSGRCSARPELEGVALPLQVHVPALPSSGGAELVVQLFEPLGWSVRAVAAPLDPHVPSWGDSRYVDVRLEGTLTPAAALSHLYVLLPVLDDAKHYWVSEDEVDKLVRAGSGWLADHPLRDLVTRRYLAHQRDYVSAADERLATDADGEELPDLTDERRRSPSPPTELTSPPAPAVPLAQQRRTAVLGELRRVGAARVVDLGCGEGALLRELLADPGFTEVVGADVSAAALERAQRRLGLDRMPDSQRARLTLLQSSLTYRDARLAGFDAVVLMEVVEHVDPPRLPDLERHVFGVARPHTLVVTTPNADYNVRYPALAAGTFRHPDHRFEWGRDEFGRWSAALADRYGYQVRTAGVGDADPELGSPTQLAVFTQAEPSTGAPGRGR